MCLTSHFFKYFGNQIKNVIKPIQRNKSEEAELEVYNKNYITDFFELKTERHVNKCRLFKLKILYFYIVK